MDAKNHSNNSYNNKAKRSCRLKNRESQIAKKYVYDDDDNGTDADSNFGVKIKDKKIKHPKKVHKILKTKEHNSDNRDLLNIARFNITKTANDTELTSQVQNYQINNYDISQNKNDNSVSVEIPSDSSCDNSHTNSFVNEPYDKLIVGDSDDNYKSEINNVKTSGNVIMKEYNNIPNKSQSNLSDSDNHKDKCVRSFRKIINLSSDMNEKNNLTTDCMEKSNIDSNKCKLSENIYNSDLSQSEDISNISDISPNNDNYTTIFIKEDEQITIPQLSNQNSAISLNDNDDIYDYAEINIKEEFLQEDEQIETTAPTSQLKNLNENEFIKEEDEHLKTSTALLQYHKQNYEKTLIEDNNDCADITLKEVEHEEEFITDEEDKEIASSTTTILQHQKDDKLRFKLDPKDRIKLIKLYDENQLTIFELHRIFNCSLNQVRNILQHRDLILKQNEEKPSTSCRINLSLKQQMDVINAFDCKLDKNQICQKLKFSLEQIEQVLLKRDDIINLYKEYLIEKPKGYSDDDMKAFPQKRKLISLEDRMDVLRAADSVKSVAEMSHKFNCSRTTIVNILLSRHTIISEYKNLHPDSIIEEHLEDYITALLSKSRKILNLEERIGVIKAFDVGKNPQKLASIFKCSRKQILNILSSRDSIIKAYNKLISKSNIEKIETNKISKNYSDIHQNNNYNNGIDQINENTSTKEKEDEEESITQEEDNDFKSTTSISQHQKSDLSTKEEEHQEEFMTDEDEENKSTAIISQHHKTDLFTNGKTDIEKFITEQENEDFESTTTSSDIRYYVNKLDLENRVKLIKAYDEKQLKISQLHRMFKCSQIQVRNILKHRDSILKQYYEKNLKQTPSPSSTKAVTPQNSRCIKNLTLDQQMHIIKSVDRNLDIDQICKIQKWSRQQIEHVLMKRDEIKKLYNEQSKKKESGKGKKNNRLSLNDRIDVLRASDNGFSFVKLSKIFNCSRSQISNILKRRDVIINKYKRCHPDSNIEQHLTDEMNARRKNRSYVRNVLSLDDRIQHLTDEMNARRKNRRYVRNVLSLDDRIGVIRCSIRGVAIARMASIFNCSYEQISNILSRREAIIKEYKNMHPDSNIEELKATEISKNSNKIKVYRRNVLSLQKQVELIKAYGIHQSLKKLGRIFECSSMQIRNIIKKRDVIMKNYNKSVNNRKSKLLTKNKHKSDNNGNVYTNNNSPESHQQIIITKDLDSSNIELEFYNENCDFSKRENDNDNRDLSNYNDNKQISFTTTCVSDISKNVFDDNKYKSLEDIKKSYCNYEKLNINVNSCDISPGNYTDISNKEQFKEIESTTLISQLQNENLEKSSHISLANDSDNYAGKSINKEFEKIEKSAVSLLQNQTKLNLENNCNKSMDNYSDISNEEEFEEIKIEESTVTQLQLNLENNFDISLDNDSDNSAGKSINKEFEEIEETTILQLQNETKLNLENNCDTSLANDSDNYADISNEEEFEEIKIEETTVTQLQNQTKLNLETNFDISLGNDGDNYAGNSINKEIKETTVSLLQNATKLNLENNCDISLANDSDNYAGKSIKKEFDKIKIVSQLQTKLNLENDFNLSLSNDSDIYAAGSNKEAFEENKKTTISQLQNQNESSIENNFDISLDYDSDDYTDISDNKEFEEIETNTTITPPKNQNQLNLEDRVKLINKHTRNKLKVNNLQSMFKCSKFEIENILRNRHSILKQYIEEIKPKSIPQNEKNSETQKQKNIRHKLSFDDRVSVIKAFDVGILPSKLSCIFKCSRQQIANILSMRKSFIKENNNLNSESNSESKQQCKEWNVLNIDDRIGVIKDSDTGLGSFAISRKYKCSRTQILNILASRDSIIKEYEKLNSESNNEELEEENITPISKPYGKESWNILNIYDRICVIRGSDTGLGSYALSRKFKCSRTQIHNILASRDSIIREYEKLNSESNIEES